MAGVWGGKGGGRGTPSAKRYLPSPSFSHSGAEGGSAECDVPTGSKHKRILIFDIIIISEYFNTL
jgi:hypothetical protein